MPIAFGGGSIVTSANIVDGSITNDDINAAAGIVASKLSGVVATAGAQNVAGVKTFLDAPIVPDEAYAAGWDGKMEPPTKNAVYDKLNPLDTSLSAIADKAVGALSNAMVKTYLNTWLPFIMWTGAVAGDLTTSFVNWVRNSTDVFVAVMGTMIDFQGTGGDYMYLPTFDGASFNFDSTKIIIVDWFAKLPAAGSAGDPMMGITIGASAHGGVVYNQNSADAWANRITFGQNHTDGKLYAVIGKQSVGVTATDISAGVTVTNWNNYRLEVHFGTDAKFYVNGVLKATLSGANLPNGAIPAFIGFGRDNTALFKVTAPHVSFQII